MEQGRLLVKKMFVFLRREAEAGFNCKSAYYGAAGRRRHPSETERLRSVEPRRPVVVKAVTRLLRFAPALRVTTPSRRGIVSPWTSTPRFGASRRSRASKSMAHKQPSRAEGLRPNASVVGLGRGRIRHGRRCRFCLRSKRANKESP
jgi:hypothetical protein